MKAYLFLLLVGFIFAYNCKNEHISVRMDGRYSSFFGEKCTCTAGMTGLIDSYNKRCFCFPTSEINACKRDAKCQLNYLAGCVNKDIRDYGKN